MVVVSVVASPSVAPLPQPIHTHAAIISIANRFIILFPAFVTNSLPVLNREVAKTRVVIASQARRVLAPWRLSIKGRSWKEAAMTEL